MNIIDIGANLTNKQFPDRNKIIAKCKQEGIGLILTGSNEKSNSFAVNLANKKGLYCTVGIHPHDAKNFNDNTIDTLRTYIKENKSIVAIGETGLDYNRMYSTKEEQLKSFRAHVELAIELQMPLFTHEREAHYDFLEVLESYKNVPDVVIHCFTGTEKEAKSYIDKGAYLGFTGFLCMGRRGRDLRRFLWKVPDDKILVETDCPYMNPVEDKSRCDPLHVTHIVDQINKLKRRNITEQILENTKRFFRLPDILPKPVSNKGSNKASNKASHKESDQVPTAESDSASNPAPNTELDTAADLVSVPASDSVSASDPVSADPVSESESASDTASIPASGSSSVPASGSSSVPASESKSDTISDSESVQV
jgi:TatD DNase family protein